MSDTRSPVDPVAGYRPWLDGLRGIAVLLVVAEHVGEGSGTWFPAGAGETGVGIFFGLSGYLITGLLLVEHGKDDRVSYGVVSVVRWTLFGCAAALVWRCVLVLVNGPELLIYHGSLERLDALLYGCAAALGVRAGWRPGRWWGWGAVAALVAAVFVSDQGVLGMTVVQAVLGLSSAALVVSLDHRSGWLRRVLSWRPIVWVGVVSYGIYLWHWPLLAIGVLRFGQHGLAVTALVGLVGSTAFAAVSYYCLERPVRTLVRGWLTRRSRSLST